MTVVSHQLQWLTDWGKKVEDLYDDTEVNRVWANTVCLCLSSCTSFRLILANILDAKCQHVLGLRNAHHSIHGELSFTLTVLKLNESFLFSLIGPKSLSHHETNHTDYI